MSADCSLVYIKYSIFNLSASLRAFVNGHFKCVNGLINSLYEGACIYVFSVPSYKGVHLGEHFVAVEHIRRMSFSVDQKELCPVLSDRADQMVV